MTKNREMDKRRKRIIVAGAEGFKDLSIGAPRHCHNDMYESPAQLFKAYFNNKMTVILLMLQRQKHDPDSLGAMKAVIFMDDIYHHLIKSEYQQRYRKVFKWLCMFFRRFPYVKPVQKRKAIEYIKIVYEMMGIKWTLKI